MRLPLSAITIDERRREDYGDINGLAASIKRYGLLHPVVVDDANRLIAGERRLRAYQQLGWQEIDTRSLGELTEAERREIELEENLRRKDLTEYERSKTLKARVEVAREIAETCAESAQVSRPARGPARTPGSVRDLEERTGIPQSTLRKAEQHVQTVEEFLPTNGPAWPQYHVLEARSHLERIPEPERPKVAALIDQPAIPAKKAVEILGNLAEMPQAERQKVLTLAESEDTRDRSRALTEAAKMPAMPDPRATWLVGEVAELRKMAKLIPGDIFSAWFSEKADEFKAMAKEIKEAHRDRNLSA